LVLFLTNINGQFPAGNIYTHIYIFFIIYIDTLRRVFLSMPLGVLLVDSLLLAFFMNFMLQSYIATLSDGAITVATMFMMAIISDKYGMAIFGVLCVYLSFQVRQIWAC